MKEMLVRASPVKLINPLWVVRYNGSNRAIRKEKKLQCQWFSGIYATYALISNNSIKQIHNGVLTLSEWHWFEWRRWRNPLAPFELIAGNVQNHLGTMIIILLIILWICTRFSDAHSTCDNQTLCAAFSPIPIPALFHRSNYNLPKTIGIFQVGFCFWMADP